MSKATKAPRSQRKVSPAGGPCPVVGIGASAGGLEALEAFFRGVLLPSGAAFVVVQHLDPTHQSLLVELLQRATALPVQQVVDGMRVEPDHVYVIPPNTDLSIVSGVLHLLSPLETPGLRLPIDFFLRSLADDLGPRSIGVVLSGMGADGTLGLRAIRERGGAIFVQAPAAAKFDAMPRSAIDAGLADVVAPADELPGHIADALQHGRPLRRLEPAQPGPEVQSAIEKIAGLLRSTTGHDFLRYKSNTLYRRIERRMSLHCIDHIDRYVRYLRENPKEGELLFAELLIGVTSFFRDPAEWELLAKEVLPALVAAAAPGARLRAWVPACSTGEEAYTLAMLCKEALEPLQDRQLSLEIFATDLDPAAITRARQGRYAAANVAGVSLARLERFFTKEDAGYRVRKEIRDAVIFATQNVLQDPPFTRIDVISCRNLLIYLTAQPQQRLIPLFHYSLRPGGVLMLGSAETVGPFTELFAPIQGKSRVYRRLDVSASAVTPHDFPGALISATPPSAPLGSSPPQRSLMPGASDRDNSDDSKVPNMKLLVEQLLLQRFMPAAVLTSVKGDVLYVSGRTGNYLELPAGKVNWNLFAMAREGLQHAIDSAFAEALATHQAVVQGDLQIATPAGPKGIQIVIEPVDEPPGLRDTMLVAFIEVASAPPTAAQPARGSRAPDRVEQELLRVREELRTTREEMQSSEEELKSANEELQSTNEELTTSKEEMQSMNEELETLNHELRAKVEELSRVGTDMKNLLDSTEIAILFLDDALHVRRYTPEAATLIKLIPGDVGRPLADLATELAYPELLEDAGAVLRTLAFREKVVQSRDQRWYNVRIIPYRTADNRIDGLVITFSPREAGRPLAAHSAKKTRGAS